MKKRLLRLLAILCAILPVATLADIADGVNDIRVRGCDGQAGIERRLRPSRGLDNVAREWSRGGRLRDALSRTDYRIVNSSSMRVEGTTNERAILNVLAKNYCNVITDPSFTEIGVFQRDSHVWIVVAMPFSAPTARDAAAVSARVLELVNQAREKARKCGNTTYRAAAPLKLSPLLQRASNAHAQDMARHSLFEHEGSDGSSAAQRVSRAGYRWRAVGENIAAGAADAETVMRGWLDSPGHCVNIMGPQYREMGVAYAVDPRSKSGIYWSQVFASQR